MGVTGEAAVAWAQPHVRGLWALCYRMTGVAADADELVQETLLRALERPPARTDEARPWLTRVAVNLARDRLRRRRREGYVGPWLPSPLEDDDAEAELGEPQDLEGRYALVESASVAFLVALERLTPRQRAVLLLREVFDAPVAEVAQVMGLSESNVKVLHHRARARLADAPRELPRGRGPEAQAALERFLGTFASGDEKALAALLTEDVHVLTDGGGQVRAAHVPVVGRAKAVLFLRRLWQLRGEPRVWRLTRCNGEPALYAEFAPGPEGWPTRTVLQLGLAPDGRVREVRAVLAPRKLAHLPA